MSVLKGLYTWTLATLLILAGCLGTGVINDTEGQSSDDSNNTDDSNSSDNTDDSSSSDHTDDSNSSDHIDDSNSSNNTDDSNSSNNTDDSSSSDSTDNNIWDENDWDAELIMNYQDQFGYFATGGSIISSGPSVNDFVDVATINTTLFPFPSNESEHETRHMVTVHIYELHVDGDQEAAHNMRFTSTCNNGDIYFSYIVEDFPAEEKYRSILPGAVFNCTHTISISSNQVNDELYWSLVYGVFNGPHD